MANFVSPGVYTIEKDVSDYAPSINPSIVGLVGFASRGPVDTPTLVTSPADLLRTFGTPDLVTGGQGIYGALEVLSKCNQVYYVRGATVQQSSARSTIPFATHPHAKFLTGALPAGAANYVFRFDVDTWNAWGVKNGETASFYAYRERPYVSGTAGGSIMPTTPYADWNTMDWQNAILAGVGDVNDAATGAFSYIPSGYTQDNGMLVARYPGATASTASKMEITTYIASGVTYTGNYLSSTPIDVNDLTFRRMVHKDNGETVSSIAIFAAPSGSDAAYLTASGDLLATTQGAASGATFQTYAGGTDGLAQMYQVGSLYPGLGYNYSAMNYAGGLQYRGLQAQVVNTNDNGRFVLDIASDGAPGTGTDESYDMAMWKPESTTSATSLWPEAVLNQGLTNAVSKYVKGNFYTYDNAGAVSGSRDWIPGVNFQAATAATSPPMGFTNGTGYAAGNATNTWRCMTLMNNQAPQDYDFSGGKNGDASDYNGNMSNGNVRTALIGAGPKAGLRALDQEDVPVTLAAVPGVTDQNVQNELMTLAENTQNFLAVVAPPVGFGSAQQAVQWSNGKATGRTSAINNSYGSVYWPWVKAFDAFTGSDMWFDPSMYALAQMCYTDEVADPWFAPAGLTRGRLSKPTDVEVKLNQGDRDALYSPGNIVNPITKFTSDGIVIYGQRTAQRASTALDRINVRRLMIYLRRLVLQGTRRFVFEPNDPITWEAVRNVLNPALADIQQRRGITAFSVVCDSTTNTPLRVDRNELWCKVILKPTKTAEILVFELNLTNQSASV